MLKRIIDKLGIKSVGTRKKPKRSNSSVKPLYNPRKNPPPLIENALRENNFSNVGTRTRSPHNGPSIPNTPSQAKNVYKQELDSILANERKLTQELNLILTSIYKPDIDEKAFREKNFKEKAMRKGASYTIEQYKAEVNKKLKEENPNYLTNPDKNIEYIKLTKNLMGGSTDQEQDANSKKIIKNIARATHIDKEEGVVA